MHLLRLLIAGVETLEHGELPVHVGKHGDQLLAIKRGEIAFDECEKWRKSLQLKLDAALEHSPLPEKPDYAAANDWLIRARRSRI